MSCKAYQYHYLVLVLFLLFSTIIVIIVKNFIVAVVILGIMIMNVLLTGWTGVIEVEAHVVTIRHAAGADDAGLLNPLLKRWQDQACSQMVFGLPAVQSVINFKWDRSVLRLCVLLAVCIATFLSICLSLVISSVCVQSPCSVH